MRRSRLPRKHALALAPCAAVAAAALAVYGCSDTVEEDVTGVLITAQYDVSLDQLELSGAIAGEEAFDPAVVPAQPAPLADGSETVALLLPDALGGSELTLRVDGMHEGAAVASGQADVTLVRGEMVDVTIRLLAPGCGDGIVQSDEGCDDGNADGGDGCSASCEVERGYQCETGPTGASECRRTCAGGCADGETCETGLCVCDPATCTGCCDVERRCQPGTSNDRCGTGGVDCAACDEADQCIGGSCGSCSPATCPDGCCSGSTCLTDRRSETACGSGGEACAACDPLRANDCSSIGECICGSNAACAPGLYCDVAQRCVCNPDECEGCCDGATCRTGEDDSACGSGGYECETCPASGTCNNGICRSQCDATCAGCCSGATCQPGTLDRACGDDGEACRNCLERGETCDPASHQCV